MKKYEKKFVDVVLFLILAFGFVVGIRTTAGGPEDSWICKDGQWQKHGNPTAEMPKEVCEK
ncbi:MAG: hypothetical protein WCK48_03380 [bacterium]